MHASCARVSLKPWRLSLSQDADDNEWKWETTQNLQREFMLKLLNISSNLHAHPDAVSSYEDLREHLDAQLAQVIERRLCLDVVMQDQSLIEDMLMLGMKIDYYFLGPEPH